MSLIFDTLKLAQGLRGPFTDKQAEQLAEALAGSTRENVATKTDIQDLRAELKGEMASLKVDLVRWIVAAIAFNFLGTAGLFLAFARVFAK